MSEPYKDRSCTVSVVHMTHPAVDETHSTIASLRERVRVLEQQLAQAGDSIELQEAEQRGFERGRLYNESR